MKNKIILSTLALTILSFGLSAILAENYGRDNMLVYLKLIATKSFNGVEIKLTETEEALTAEKINEVEINTTELDVKIEKSKDNKLRLFYNKAEGEKVSDLIKINGLVMKIDLDSLSKAKAKLHFRFEDNGPRAGFIVQERGVRVSVPENVKKIKIKTVSGESRIVDMSLDNVEIESVSGHIDIQGKVSGINAKTISGDFLVNSDLDNPKVKISTVSGDTRAVFKSEPNINFKFETVSGEVSFSESLARKEISGAVKDLHFGKGEGSFEVQSTSGDVKIEKY
jgi:DUF4097 and DUF4098 domain-containing protein YvlB